MGNALLDESTKEDPQEVYERWLEQNPDLVSRQILSHNKLFQTCFFKYCERNAILKVFFRRDNTPLEEYVKAFSIILQLANHHQCMHVMPMRILGLRDYKDKQLEKYEQNFILATRQYLQLTLERRLQVRPSLSCQQKMWFIFQMILSVYTVHQIFNLYHGNIRTSNFLLTTYQYLIITDFASYKPNYILQDTEKGLAQFRLFYSSSIQKCNIAPEKMVGQDNIPSSIQNSKKLFSLLSNSEKKDKQASNFRYSLEVSKSFSTEQVEGYKQVQMLKMMDMYSLGVSILEVINDGKEGMSYEQMIKMKKQGWSLNDHICQSLKKMGEKGQGLSIILRGLLKQKGQDRLTITQVQQLYNKVYRTDINILFWCCLSAFNKTSFASSDLRIHLVYSILSFIETNVKQSSFKFVNSPPKCLSGFQSLYIFVQMIKKKLIFMPAFPNLKSSQIFIKLFKKFETTETKQEVESQEEVIQQKDERQAFFITPIKTKKLGRKLSFLSDVKQRDKYLCPPNYSQIQWLQNKQKILGMKQGKLDRMSQLLNEYIKTQYLREQKLAEQKYYINSEIIIKTIFSCIRSCKYVTNKLLAIQMMLLVGKDCDDNVILKVLLPFLMHLTQDSDISVAKYAFLGFLDAFYYFVDPFHQEEDIYYFEVILDFIINCIKPSKLRICLFSNFKGVYYICEWLQIHYRRFNRQSHGNLTRIVDTLIHCYGSFSSQQIQQLLNNNIPDHLMTEMFPFYISLINTDKILCLKYSIIVAKSVNSSTPKHMVDTFDNCVESGLEQYGIGLFYAIKYFTIRKTTIQSIIRRIAPHVINPNKWIRDEAIKFIKMCLEQYPPTKNYFFFKDIFQPPFPLKPADIEQDILLPVPLKDTDIDIKQRKLSSKLERPNSITLNSFNDYLKNSKINRGQDKRRQQMIEQWNQQSRAYKEKDLKEILNFKSYIRKQIELLYEYNLFYYVLNMNSKFPHGQKDKVIEKGYPELVLFFKKLNKNSSFELTSINHEKKEMFQQLKATINNNFQKLLNRKNKENGQLSTDKLRLGESITIIGEVINKFQMFKIRPIPKLGDYARRPTQFERIPRPKGVLVSEIFQHKDTISCIQKVADHFFLSGSLDGTLKIFDSKKIQMNITTTSQATIEIKADNSEEKAKINSISTFEYTYAAVVGSSKGHIRIYPIERMSNKSIRNEQILKYNVNGEIQKVITLTNELKNECFCYITAQGHLGIQDIRIKSKILSCNIGKERGIPKSVCATSKNSILVGTVDGYLVTFDIRYNIVSSVLQLQNDGQSVPITNIYPCPLSADQNEQTYAFTYPSKYYQFSYFNIFDDRLEFSPEKQFTSASNQQIITTPYFINKTNEQQFKICRNNLIWRRTYDQLSDFHKNFNIYDYLSDPLTRKQAKIRQIWLDNCKNRYTQISSIYNRKCLPFLQYLSSGILTHCNPYLINGQRRGKHNLTFLIDRFERQPTEIQRIITSRSNYNYRLFNFPEIENKDYLTCCKALPNFIVAGCRNSMIKIYM